MTEPHETDAAVAEPEGPVTKASVERELKALQASISVKDEQRRAIEDKGAHATVEDMKELSAIELWLARQQPEVERLQTDLANAQIPLNARQAVEGFNAGLEAQRAKHRVVQACYNALFDALEDVGRGGEAQWAHFAGVTSPRGEKYPTPDKAAIIDNVASQMPAAAAMRDILRVGRLGGEVLKQMMDIDTSTREKHQPEVERFLRGEHA